jgi:hypothetical protein
MFIYRETGATKPQVCHVRKLIIISIVRLMTREDIYQVSTTRLTLKRRKPTNQFCNP